MSSFTGAQQHAGLQGIEHGYRMISDIPGHLMGKKSLPVVQETKSDYITSSETARVTERDRYQGLLEALMLPKNPQRQKMPKPAENPLAEEDKYLPEVG